MGDYLDDVRWLRMEVEDLAQDIDRQIEELQEFVTGQRQSIYPLGKRLLINAGLRLDALRQELEYRLADFN